MEDFLYFCLMLQYITLTYFKNIIAGVKTPSNSLLCCSIHIGRSVRISSISDFIKNKTKSVGLFNKSMSQISFCKYLNLVGALLSSNSRPNLNLQLPKLSFFRLNLYQIYW